MRYRLGILFLISTLLTGALSAQKVWNAREDLRISAQKFDLSSIGRIAVSRSGIIAVAQPQDVQVRFFDAQGRFRKTFGSRGEGPGEFRFLGQMGWNADTLWIMESPPRRITLVGPEFKLLRSFPGPLTLLAPGGKGSSAAAIPIATMALLPDNALLASVLTAKLPVPSWLTVDSLNAQPLLRVSPDGTLQRVLLRQSIAAVPPPCRAKIEILLGNGEKGHSQFSLPFCGIPLRETATDGRTAVYVFPEFREGPIGSYRVVILDLTVPDTVLSKRFEYATTKIGRDVLDSARKAIAGRRGAPPEVKAASATIALPKTFPPIRRIVIGEDGTFWLEEFLYPSPAHRWRVLDRTGKILGVVEFPQQFDLRVARLGTVWGTMGPAFDEQDVVRMVVR